MAFRANRTPLVAPRSIEHHVEDLSATFSADVTLREAQAKLREHGQWLPIDGGEDETLGALVDRNSTGPLRLGFGAWRDLLLGAQFTNGEGDLISAGGRTVKNVAGYDLTKFMVGQYGVFGRLVTLTTRTYKMSEFALLARFDPDAKKLNTLLATPCRPHWAVLKPDAMHCGYLGDAPAMEFFTTNLSQYGAHSDPKRCSIDEEIELRRGLWSTNAHASHTFRASVPPARIADFVRSIGTTDWSADAAFGVVIGSCNAPEALHKAAGNVGGSVILFDADGRPQNLSLDPAVVALLSRLKNSFDPKGNLQLLPLAPS